MKPSTTGHFAISLLVTGKDLSSLDTEAGGHRWQRIPPTEKRGRVHTSTVTVSVTDPDAIASWEMREQDLSVSWYSGSGAGGQHRNRHCNSIRMTHIPTGISATAQTRSRQNSYKSAREAIEEKLKNYYNSIQQSSNSLEKRQQIGSGQRGDKIRTIRLQDDQVKDHRTGLSTTAARYMKGYIDDLWR